MRTRRLRDRFPNSIVGFDYLTHCSPFSFLTQPFDQANLSLTEHGHGNLSVDKQNSQKSRAYCVQVHSLSLYVCMQIEWDGCNTSAQWDSGCRFWPPNWMPWSEFSLFPLRLIIVGLFHHQDWEVSHRPQLQFPPERCCFVKYFRGMMDLALKDACNRSVSSVMSVKRHISIADHRCVNNVSPFPENIPCLISSCTGLWTLCTPQPEALVQQEISSDWNLMSLKSYLIWWRLMLFLIMK